MKINRRVVRGVVIAAVLVAAGFGFYKVWWTPAIGGEPTTGEPAPAFTLEDQNGATVELAGLLKNGPVVVAFYRGYW